VQPTLYSYNMLSRATWDFHQDNKLGEGGFGVVYKVILSTSCMPFYHHLSFYFGLINNAYHFDNLTTWHMCCNDIGR